MTFDIDNALAKLGGAATRTQLLRGMTRGTLDNEARAGRLTRVFPSVYCRPWDADLAAVREHAAVLSIGMPAALSHPSALRRWGLLASEPPEIHVTVPISRHPYRTSPGIVIHRTRRFPPVVRHSGVVTVSAAAAVVSAWPMFSGSDQRAPALSAYRQRLATPAELRDALTFAPNLRRRRSLEMLIELVAAGCESELELWGYLNVFDVPGLRHAERQRWLHVGGRRFRADMLYDAERLIVELDGRSYHSSPDQWERDCARDLALAKVGWQTIRLSHRRLTTDVAGCRRDVLAVLGERRSWRLSR